MGGRVLLWNGNDGGNMPVDLRTAGAYNWGDSVTAIEWTARTKTLNTAADSKEKRS
jgi:hypothetical protein